MTDLQETNFEFLKGDKHGCFSSSQQKWINKIKRLSEQYPDEVKIVKMNKDGSICAHLPVSWFKITPKKKRNLSEEQIQVLKERAAKMGKSRKRE